jgi:hypothetical protein
MSASATDAATAPDASTEGGVGDPVYRRVATDRKTDDPNSRCRRAVAEDDAFWEEKLATARSEAAAGSDDLAYEMIASTLRLEPPEPWAGRFKSLRVELKARQLDTDVLRVDARGERDYVPFGEDVVVVLRLRNVGTREVVVWPPGGAGQDETSGAAFSLSISRRDVDVYAAEMRRSWTQLVPIVTAGTGELRIPPEGVHEVRARVPASDAGDTLAGVRVLELGGTLRAGRIDAGLGEPLGRVPVRPGRILVLPRNYEPLAADPVGSIRKAVAASAPVHVLVAAHFVSPEERPEAVQALGQALVAGAPELGPAALAALRAIRRDAAGTPLRPLAAPLMEALASRPPREGDVMEGLVALTGLPLAPDARLWEDWWRREQAGPGASVAAEDATAAPRAPGKPRAGR